jgi:hypothetical protein
MGRVGPIGRRRGTKIATRGSVTAGEVSNRGDAHDTLTGYEAFGGSEGPKLYVKGNAVLAWDDTPTGDEKATVDGCLTKA